MKRILFSILLILFFSARVAAQQKGEDNSPLLNLSYGVLIAGNIADIGTTQEAFSRGAHESVGLLTAGTQDIKTIAISRIIIVSGLAYLMHSAQKHDHPTLAKMIGFIDGGLTLGAAIHNTNVK